MQTEITYTEDTGLVAFIYSNEQVEYLSEDEYRKLVKQEAIEMIKMQPFFNPDGE